VLVVWIFRGKED